MNDAVAVKRLPTEAFIPVVDAPYVDNIRAGDLFPALCPSAPTILVGPKGTGKSLAVASYAESRSIPVVTVDCSEDLRRPNLVGMFVLEGDSTPFVLGPLATAFEVAAEAGLAILLLEEINALSPQAQKILNPLTDFRRKLEVPEAGRVYRLPKGADLWVVGTMNETTYGGVYALNEDLKSRFRMLPVGYPSLTEEVELLSTVLPDDVRKGAGEAFIKGIAQVAYETRQGGFDYALSPRDLVQICEDAARIGAGYAIRLALGKMEGSDRTAFLERVRSSLDITVDL